MKIPVMSLVVCVDFTRIKCDYFVSFSTTTMIELCCFTIIGENVIKSIEISTSILERAKDATVLLDVDFLP